MPEIMKEQKTLVEKLNERFGQMKEIQIDESVTKRANGIYISGGKDKENILYHDVISVDQQRRNVMVDGYVRLSPIQHIYTKQGYGRRIIRRVMAFVLATIVLGLIVYALMLLAGFL